MKMKKLAVSVCMVYILFLPLIACAGNAFIATWMVQPPDAWGNPKVVTNFSVANILNQTQTVTITLRNADGSPASGLTYGYSIGGLNGCSVADANGKIILSVPPFNYVTISVLDNGMAHRGYGTIAGDRWNGLIATELINFPDNLSLSLQAVTINGGNPF
jgi:hypothetical protein